MGQRILLRKVMNPDEERTRLFEGIIKVLGEGKGFTLFYSSEDEHLCMISTHPLEEVGPAIIAVCGKALEEKMGEPKN